MIVNFWPPDQNCLNTTHIWLVHQGCWHHSLRCPSHIETWWGSVVDLSCSRCVPQGWGIVPGLCCDSEARMWAPGCASDFSCCWGIYHLLISGERRDSGDKDGVGTVQSQRLVKLCGPWMFCIGTPCLLVWEASVFFMLMVCHIPSVTQVQLHSEVVGNVLEILLRSIA